ncbi:MAG: PepSY domain-containing protein [Lactobacillales bacterium]|jgi:predicted small secreted protein|nr:PepSY domain-containing protein [Lactobacillales bacterium]
MKQQKKITYLKVGLGAGVILGLAAGISATLLFKQKKTLTSEDVLNQVKHEFLKEGPIEASWIHEEKEPLNKFAIHTKNYKGGIIRKEGNETVTYEFVADAKTGTVIEIHRLEEPVA